MTGFPPLLIDLDEVLAHSYRDFHAKGFDYLCLRRTPDKTIKVYFFDGDVSKAPEVVIPHDHRYDFHTDVLSGSVVNRKFCRSVEGVGQPYEEFAYRTPLNGGDGFTWAASTFLRQYDEFEYFRGDGYAMSAAGIHTIQITGPQTVLCLTQYADVVPLDAPTSAFRPDGKEPPNLDGLYARMDADYALDRLELLYRLTGAGSFQPSEKAA